MMSWLREKLGPRRAPPDAGAGTHNLATRERWMEATLAALPAGTRILDAGAGELKYKRFCGHLDYLSQDFGQYDGKGNTAGLQIGAWDNSRLDIVSDITAIPVAAESFGAIMCIEVFEHIPDPRAALREFTRLLKPGGHLILTAPFCSLTHFAPYYFVNGFSRYWYERMLPEAGFQIQDLQTNGNYFEYIAQEIRRLPQLAQKWNTTPWTAADQELALRLLNRLALCSAEDKGSDQTLHFGCLVHAIKQARP